MRHVSLPQADTTGLVGAVELVAMLRRSWLWVAGAAGTGLLCAALWLHDATVPDWRAEARMTLAPDLATDGGNAAIAHATELERLRGTAMTREVAARLGFDRDPGYVDWGKPPLIAALDRWIGHPPTAPLADRAVERLRSRTSVQLVPGSAVAAYLGQRRRSCAGGPDRLGFRRTVCRHADRGAGPGRTAGQRGTRRPRRRGGPGAAGAGRAARLRRARGRAGHDRPRIARQPHPAAQRARGRAPHGRRHRGKRPAAAGPGADGPPAGGARRHGRRARG